MKQLLIGCGQNITKKLSLGAEDPVWDDLTTLDINPNMNPDIVWDLNKTPYSFAEDNTFDEIHAYEVLEHLGTLGDYKTFFTQFEELWRILKPDGLLLGTAPAIISPWLFGDPGHTRVISNESLTFLSQSAYSQIEKGSPMSDYRYLYKGNFGLIYQQTNGIIYIFVLKALKGA